MISALFVDFDNVFRMLEDDDKSLSKKFCNKPKQWVDALVQMIDQKNPDKKKNRRIVSKRCYASPYLIQSHRTTFVRAGLEMIDMPPLTSGSKNAADIQMVVDIMDSVLRYNQIEEYIILSGDSDFVPLLHRLRRDMKSTTVFAPSKIAAAYENCADGTITVDFFRGVFQDDSNQAPKAERVPAAAKTGGVKSNKEIDGKVLNSIIEFIKLQGGRTEFGEIAANVRLNFPFIKEQNWNGYGAFSKYMNSIIDDRFSIDNTIVTHPSLLLKDFVCDLSSWGDCNKGDFPQFVSDIMRLSSKKIPFIPPETFQILVDEIVKYYNDQPEDFAQAITHVVEALGNHGKKITPHDVRAIGTAVSLQGYKIDRGVSSKFIAQLWRLAVFDQCGQPEWLEEKEEAEHLVRWFRSSDEEPEAAVDHFLAIVSDGIGSLDLDAA